MSKEIDYMTTFFPHTPVLLDTSVEFLIKDPNGIYIDATLGGAGHTMAFLNALSENATLLGVDQDEEAHVAASEKIGDDPRFIPITGNFGYLSTIIPTEYLGNISGIFFDLGVSTHQIKEPERGFSFQSDGPLDMRMSEMSGITAYDIVNSYDYEKLRDIIYHYGEERLSRQISKEIIDNRPIESTLELRKVIENVLYGPHIIKSVARVFQAIRIEVNREMEMLKRGLKDSLELLAPGGRIVAISYHSLEDRLVKNFLKSGNFDGEIEKDFYGNPLKPLNVVTKQIITPSDQEVQSNPASRSAKLRVGEKIEEE